jgi:hypothetical protein
MQLFLEPAVETPNRPTALNVLSANPIEATFYAD